MDFNMRANEGQLRTVKFETAALQFEGKEVRDSLLLN